MGKQEQNRKQAEADGPEAAQQLIQRGGGYGVDRCEVCRKLLAACEVGLARGFCGVCRSRISEAATEAQEAIKEDGLWNAPGVRQFTDLHDHTDNDYLAEFFYLMEASHGTEPACIAANAAMDEVTARMRRDR